MVYSLLWHSQNNRRVEIVVQNNDMLHSWVGVENTMQDGIETPSQRTLCCHI